VFDLLREILEIAAIVDHHVGNPFLLVER